MQNTNRLRCSFLVIWLLLAFWLTSCSLPKPIEITYTVENPDSQLIKLLLRESDFDRALWSIDYAEVLQSNKTESNGLIESATFWVVARDTSADQYFRITHNLLMYQSFAPQQVDDLFIFKEMPTRVRALDDVPRIDTARCAEFDDSKFQDCIFIRRYDQLVSIFTISTSKDLEESVLLDLISPFLKIIDQRLSSSG